jgi:hypothetical protein
MRDKIIRDEFGQGRQAVRLLVEDIGWRGVRIDRDRQRGKGKPTGYPVDRGTPRVSNDDAQSAAAELATRLPVVCTAAHRTRSASNHQGDLTMPMDLAGSNRLKTYSARVVALSKAHRPGLTAGADLAFLRNQGPGDGAVSGCVRHYPDGWTSVLDRISN